MGDQAVRTTCLCGECQFSFSVDSSRLPLPSYLCHCDDCRRTSGSIFTSYITAAELSTLKPENHTDKLKAYSASEAYRRWFCKTCGTHMVIEAVATGQIHLTTGTIDAESSDGIVDFKGHMWLRGSKDGGAGEFIHTLNGKPAGRWLAEPGTSERAPQGWRSQESGLDREAEAGSIPLHCHCNRVQLQVTRPTEASENVKTKQGVCWWLSADRKHYVAGFCMCRSCRLGIGFDSMSWAFFPLPNLEFPDGRAVHGTDEGLETDDRVAEALSVFKSRTQEGVKRYFCPDCGATVFWFTPSRPQLLDVATALLDDPAGVRAENWLEWHTDRISCREEALNKGLLAGLEAGLKVWGQGRC